MASESPMKNRIRQCALGGILATGMASASVPPGAAQFSCADFGMQPDSNWSFADFCYSYELAINPFSGDSLSVGHAAIITGVEFTPTTSAIGSYYLGIAQSTSGGSRFNPQIFFRGSDQRSLEMNGNAPILVINRGNTFQVFNSSTSPGEARVRVHGFIVDDLTVNPEEFLFSNGFE